MWYFAAIHGLDTFHLPVWIAEKYDIIFEEYFPPHTDY